MDFGAEFLENPQLFPARRSGEAFGESEVSFALGDAVHSLRGLDESQHRMLLSWLEGSGVVVKVGSKVDIQTSIFRAADHDFRRFELFGFTEHHDIDYRPRRLRLAGRNFMGLVDRPTLEGALWIAPSVDNFRDVIENYLRTITSFQVVSRGGMLVHGASVVHRGGGVLCFGPSGSGKTTASRLALEAGHSVVSDDMTAIVADGTGFRVLRVPFHGDFSETELSGGSWPLKAVLWLQKSEHNALTPLPKALALAHLVSCCPFVNRDPFQSAALMENVSRLLEIVPAYTLEFLRDAGCWETLDNLPVIDLPHRSQ